MHYTLKDGRKVDLSRVVEVSTVRDEGSDANSISDSLMSFIIYMKGKKEIKVARNYHFADWGKQKLELNAERRDLIKALNDFKKLP